MAAKSRQNTHPLETGTPNPPGGPERMDGQPKPLSPDASTAVAIASPALDLQQRLGEQLSAFHAHPEVTAPEPSEHWSTRRTLAFVIVSNGVAWASIAWMVSSLLA